MSTTQSSSPRTSSHLRQSFDDALYLLTTWPVVVIAFCLVITILALGAGLLVVVIGAPILAAGLLMARSFATFERRRIASFPGNSRVEHVYPPHDEGWRRSLGIARDEQSWFDVLWLCIMLAVSSITFTLALTWILGSLATVLAPIATIVLEAVGIRNGLFLLIFDVGGAVAMIADITFQVVTGLIFLVTSPFVLRALTRIQQGISDAMLNSRGRASTEIASLRASRASAKTAEEQSLRRLERDIHDGPQQRLVRLQMDLARAKRQAAQDPEKAQELLEGAISLTGETLAELRQLSRGIAPPVLADRGLEAAIGEAATRSSVPVSVFADLPRHLPAHAETTAYFVASEALANINKHSGAHNARITAATQDEHLFISIVDDGRGGASTAKGHGLAGLAERVRGVGGTLTVESPEGGPTRIEAMIPCEL